MGIKDPNFILTFENTNEGEYKISSEESLLIKAIYASGTGSTEEYLQILVDRTSVGFYAIGGSRGNHLQYRRVEDPEDSNVLVTLTKRGIFKGIPVGAGQILSWKTKNGNNVTVTIEGELYDVGDIKPDMENGSQATSFVYLNYGIPSSDPSGAGDVLVDKTLNPAEYPDFPFAGTVPAKSKITIYGICANDVAKSSDSGGNKARTKYVKFVKGREVLFDPNRSGLTNIGINPTSDGTFISSGESVFGFNSTIDKKPAYFFRSPLVFSAGEELNVFHDIELLAGSMNLTKEDLMIALIMKYEKVE